MIALRLVPAVPFNVLNYAFGLLVRRRDHALDTAIGIVPGTVAFVALGDSALRPGSLGFVLSLGAVVLLVIGSTVHARRDRRLSRVSAQPAQDARRRLRALTGEDGRDAPVP